MLDAFREGGWGMYPTTVIGLALLYSMWGLVRRPERPVAATVWGLAAATMVSGVLGFLVGTIRTFQAVGTLPWGRQFGVMLMGLGESLHNVTLALVFWVILALSFAVRGRRDAARFRS